MTLSPTGILTQTFNNECVPHKAFYSLHSDASVLKTPLTLLLQAVSQQSTRGNKKSAFERVALKITFC